MEQKNRDRSHFKRRQRRLVFLEVIRRKQLSHNVNRNSGEVLRLLLCLPFSLFTFVCQGVVRPFTLQKKKKRKCQYLSKELPFKHRTRSPPSGLGS